MTVRRASRSRRPDVGGAGPSGADAGRPVAAHTNRFGDTYYLHHGTTKTGRARYFVARAVGPGALSAMPEGFEFAESINGVVSVKRVGGRSGLVPQADVDAVRREMARHDRLRHYAVDVRKDEIIVYEPEGSLVEMVQDPAGWGRAFGLPPEVPVRRLEARAPRTRYAPVMKFGFAFICVPDVYLAFRRSYSLESGWWMLSHGPLLELLRKYLPHLGTEKFFELL